MKLTTMTQVTVDGVMQGNGPADVDRGNGFERGGWAMGAGDNETRAFITETYQRGGARSCVAVPRRRPGHCA